MKQDSCNPSQSSLHGKLGFRYGSAFISSGYLLDTDWLVEEKSPAYCAALEGAECEDGPVEKEITFHYVTLFSRYNKQHD